MSEDKQVEVWRAEFEQWAKSSGHNTTLKHHGEYLNFNTYKAWAVWLAAKRSMQPIELPSGHGMTISYREGISAAKDAITAAGYSYKVKSQA